MIMNHSVFHRSCRNLLRTATISRPVGIVQRRGHSRIVNVSRGYDKPTLFFNHQTQSPGIVSVHGKGTKTNSCSGGNIATIFARGKADVSHESTHEKEVVHVQLNGFRDRLADFGSRFSDIGSNVENRLADAGKRLSEFSNRISSSEKTMQLLSGGMAGGMVGLFGTMLGLFAKIESTSEKLNNKIDSTSKDLNNKIDSTSKELNNKIDVKVDKLSEDLNNKIDKVNNKIDALVAKIDEGNSRKSWLW